MLRNRIIILLMFFFSVQSSGCVPLLIVGGVGVASRASNARYEQLELDAKREYGEYVVNMQNTNTTPILTFEDWLEEQIQNPEKSKKWKKVLNSLKKEKMAGR